MDCDPWWKALVQAPVLTCKTFTTIPRGSVLAGQHLVRKTKATLNVPSINNSNAGNFRGFYSLLEKLDNGS